MQTDDGAIPVDQMLGQATDLFRSGQLGPALAIYDRILAIQPANHVALRCSAACLMTKGYTHEALARLIAAKCVGGLSGDLIRDIDALLAPALADYNRHLADGDVSGASIILDGICSLANNTIATLEAAIRLAVVAKRTWRVIEHSISALELDRFNVTAISALADLSIARGNSGLLRFGVLSDAAEIGNRVRHFLERQQDDSERDTFSLKALFEISNILWNYPVEEGFGLIRSMVDACASHEARVRDSGATSPRSDHCHTIIRSLDADSIARPTPKAKPWPAVAVADAAGRKIDASSLRSIAAAVDARVVFFVAADSVYLMRFGRTYVRCMLDKCDVNCVVAVMVAGGIDKIADIAASVGVDDPRLVYFGSSFTPSGATHYDSNGHGPDTGLTHYQSARFLWLGYVMEGFGLPVIITDIDVVLRGSIAALLDRHRDDDVSLNKWESFYVTNRLSANMVMVNPTEPAKMFVRYLRAYLEKALRQDRVYLFVDQAALAMAMCHLAYHRAGRIGEFHEFDMGAWSYVAVNRENIGDAQVAEILSRYTFLNCLGYRGDAAIEIMDRLASLA